MRMRVHRFAPLLRVFGWVWRSPRSFERGSASGRRRWESSPVAFIIAASFAIPAYSFAAGGGPATSSPTQASQPSPAPTQEKQEPPAAQPEVTAAASESTGSTRRGSGGMVRYDKPVFRNGHLVLWHGAWRNGGHSSGASTAPPAGAAAKPSDLIIVADSADASSTRMASEFAAAMRMSGVSVKAVSGKTSAAALDKAVSDDTADLAMVPLDALLDSSAVQPGNAANDWRQRAPYIARLSSEPIEVIAPRTVTDIHQLAGRKVNVDVVDSATAASAAIVFSRLNIAPTLTNDRLPDALAHLTHGDVDAVFVVGGRDSKALADFGKDGRFHFVSIPYSAALQGPYCPMRLVSRDQPNLIGADEKVDTLGVALALVAIDATADAPRADRVAPATTALFEQFDKLFGSSQNSSWKEVNLAARIVGLPRLAAAQTWLEQNKGTADAGLDSFRDMAQTAATSTEGPSGADADRLYQSLMQWSGAAQ
jgi:TRAP-type uncharacterized transport system substrate-binding protein